MNGSRGLAAQNPLATCQFGGGLHQSEEIKKKTWYYKENNTNPMKP